MGKLNDKDLDQTIRSYRVEIDRLEKGKPLVELYRELLLARTEPGTGRPAAAS